MKTSAKLIHNQAGFAHLAILMFVAVLGALGAAGVIVYARNNSKAFEEPTAETVAKTDGVQADVAAELPAQDEAASQPQSTPKSTSSKPAQSATTQPISQPNAVQAEPKNCLPLDANQYQATWSSKNTQQVLQSNGYTETKKFHDALVFAGLMDTVNANKTVVFAVNDYVWDNDLSQAQKDYLFADPANMRAMLKWQIAQSCVIWDGYIADSTGAVHFNTMAGQVTHYYGSPGNINGAKMAMWDFFSSNGAMHLMSDLISPPSVP